jgi:hypothetical protein
LFNKAAERTTSHLKNQQMGDRKDERFEATFENDGQNITGQGSQSTGDQPKDRD